MATIANINILCLSYSNDIDTFKILICTSPKLFCVYGKKSKILVESLMIIALMTSGILIIV